MKVNFALPAILQLSICATVAGQDRIECTVTNPLSNLRENEPVVIRLADSRKELPDYVGGYVSVYDGNIEICSQQDDFDGDDLWNELVCGTLNFKF